MILSSVDDWGVSAWKELKPFHMVTAASRFTAGRCVCLYVCLDFPGVCNERVIVFRIRTTLVLLC